MEHTGIDPLVSVVLGSKSDIEIYGDVSKIFKQLGISYEKRIISAHRTPGILAEYVPDAEKRGIEVFIAIAGMAAALPGAIASFTIRPVIGVPVAKNSTILGLDALLSIVQMPPGIPVAGVSINGGKNAALLAASIIAVSNAKVEKALRDYRTNQRDSILRSDEEFTRDQ